MTIDVPTFVRLEHHATSYSRIHGLLAERRGPARDHLCACGQPAVRWAYQHSAGEEEERMNDKGHPYSLNLLDYEPMCSPCHDALDDRGGRRRAATAMGKRRCSCGWVMRAASIGMHQKSSGCVGWEDV